MKIDTVTVVTKKYKVELTEEQLIALGLLSYRHEDVRSVGYSFYRMLPNDIKVKIGTKAANHSNVSYTDLGIDWNA